MEIINEKKIKIENDYGIQYSSILLNLHLLCKWRIMCNILRLKYALTLFKTSYEIHI